jgi:hypothetical protein
MYFRTCPSGRGAHAATPAAECARLGSRAVPRGGRRLHARGPGRPAPPRPCAAGRHRWAWPGRRHHSALRVSPQSEVPRTSGWRAASARSEAGLSSMSSGAGAGGCPVRHGPQVTATARNTALAAITYRARTLRPLGSRSRCDRCAHGSDRSREPSSKGPDSGSPAASGALWRRHDTRRGADRDE